MMGLVYNLLTGDEITDDIVESCAALFSTNYGVWGDIAASLSPYTKPGQNVKFSGKRLRQECIADPLKTVLVVCFVDSKLCGHALATVWEHEGVSIGWVTQLVVDKSMRRRYIATQLLQALKLHALFKPVSIIGVVSSHPATCQALAKYANLSIGDVDLSFISRHVEMVLKSTPIKYLKQATPRRTIVHEHSTEQAVVCSLDTGFYVDHGEPLAVLSKFKESHSWSLGDLCEGHEFLVILPTLSLLPQ